MLAYFGVMIRSLAILISLPKWEAFLCIKLFEFVLFDCRCGSAGPQKSIDQTAPVLQAFA